MILPLASASLLTVPGYAAGQEPNDSEKELREKAPAEQLELPPSFEFDEDDVLETEVRGYELRPTDESTTFGETIDVSEKTRGSSSVGEVLSEASGVQVRRAGGPGSPAATSIRGSTSSQVPIYLDGVRLNAGGFPTVDLSILSLDTLSEIQVYRGGAPLGVGGAGIGGAVSMHTRLAERPLSEIAVGYGSWNTARLTALRMDRIDELGFLGVLSVEGSEGDFRYLNRNGTLHNTDDDRIRRRSNNQSLGYGNLLKLDGPLGGCWRWIAANDLHQRRRGVPGIDSLPTSRARMSTFRDAASLRLEGPLDDDLRLEVETSYLLIREDFDDTYNEIGIGYQRTISRADTVESSALLEADLAEGHITSLRAEGNFESFGYRELVAGESPDPARRLRTSLGLQHRWLPWEQLSLVPALRVELHRSKFGGGELAGDISRATASDSTDVFFSPSFGARWEAVEGLFFRANVGRYLRTPDLSELYGDRGSVIGNPELEPEVGINADAGASWIHSGTNEGLTLLRLDVAWFGSWAEDLITYVQNSQNTIRPENVDAARILGVETGLHLLAADLVSLQGNYTYLDAINLSDKPYHDGKRLPGRPQHEAYARLELGRTAQRWGGAVWFDADWAGKVYLDQANLKEDAMGRMLLGLGYRIERPREGLTLTLEVENLLDTITLQDADGNDRPVRDYDGFPLPGRTVMATLHWKM